MVCRIGIERYGKKVLPRKGKMATIACPKEKSHIGEMNVKKRLLIVRKQDSSLSTREAIQDCLSIYWGRQNRASK